MRVIFQTLTEQAMTSYSLAIHSGSRFRIDSFDVPASARPDFEAAMHRSLAFITTLPGFLWHEVFEKTNGPSRFNVVTIAAWESEEAINNALAAVRTYYQQIGFDPAVMMARWGVAGEIGQYYRANA